ncbi:hypothetical protein MNEG_6194 [Monoraphidium neglectum]|uniref:CTLH domain-containing protein n=1 Tax=Monoraphidium neglectum TaxID=145388 RepID=A0A0D2L3I8_9CHLO|nr:hypothetical protein MNEG_6194 [Monoraphidium neglectum]KIZ01764.1 hypothetical protein MNEG_6194 [Monoraphidium neglectum]|eukprot:XP_013900783.1 hypothetical protein MNEG_6194 [Monoraphidium neglectum]
MAPAPPLEPAAQAAHGVVAAGEPGAAAASAAAAGGAAAAGAALPSAEVEDAVRRQQIYDAVCAGRLEEALQQVDQHYGLPALDASPGLSFRLKVQRFLELVRARAPPQSILEYGRAQLAPAAAGPEDEELLSDAVSLLAYAEPEASPCGTLLLPGARAELGDRLNGALLAARGRPLAPALERLYRQAAVTLDELRRAHEPRALVLDLHTACMGR